MIVAPPFFEKRELDEFTRRSRTINQERQPYRSGVPAEKEYRQRMVDTLGAKTRYWARMVCPPRWTYSVHARAQDGNSYVPYFWAKIFRVTDRGKLVFFTVGVDADDNGLIWKLDRQSKAYSGGILNEDQEERYQEVVKRHKLEPEYREASRMHEYDWAKLLAESRQYILDNQHVYDEAIREVGSVPYVDHRLARLCWNDLQWTRPSGREGKSRSNHSHEWRFGYGHEEWLFDPAKELDGWRYGFLEAVRKDHGAFSGKAFHVTLYGINGRDHGYYAVGDIRVLEVLTVDQAREAEHAYRQNGWIADMEAQIRTVVPDATGLSHYGGLDLVNVRFKSADLVVYPEHIPLAEMELSVGSARYKFYRSATSTRQIQGRLNRGFKLGPTGPAPPGISRGGYTRSERFVQLPKVHREISDKLYEFLVATHGEDAVRVENPTGQGGTRIDMLLVEDKRTTFFEIKTGLDVRSCVRMALGQLLEYAHWTKAMNAQKLVVVSQHLADDEVREYMKHLREILKRDIFYQQFDLKSNRLLEEV